MAKSHSFLRRLIGIALACASFCVFATVAVAAPGINRQINYQGRLLDSSGQPVADGPYDLTLSFYDAASGGTRLWTAAGTVGSPTSVSVTVTNGLFSIQLGDTVAGQNPFSFDFNQDSLYLGVSVEADAEMTPRKRLTSVPYAFVAETLQGQYASSSVASGQSLFTLKQTSTSAATSDRTALMVRTSGTSNVFDYLIKANSGSDVFTVSRQGNVTTTGNLAVGTNMLIADGSITKTNGDLSISSSANVLLNPTGNVGVGTSNPSESLDVAGGIDNTLENVSDFALVGTETITDPGGGPQSVIVQGNYAYGFDGSGTKAIFVTDITDPTHPTSVSRYAVSNAIIDAKVSGKYIYYTDGALLHIVDISNPSALAEVATTTFAGLTRMSHIALTGRYAYVMYQTASDLLLGVVDITDAANPVLVSSAPFSVGPTINGGLIDIAGRYAYVMDCECELSTGTNALTVLDLDDPDAPVVVGTVTLPDTQVTSQQVKGDMVYLGSDYTNSLFIVDVSDPANPFLIASTTKGTINTDFVFNTIRIQGRYLYAGSKLDGAAGIVVYDVASTTNPVFLGMVTSTASNIFTIDVVGRYAYAPTPDNTVEIYRIPGITTASLLASSAEFGSLQILTDATIDRLLSVGTSLRVGTGGIFTSGALAVGSTNTTSTFAGPLTVQGQSVCLEDGTNCPASGGSDTLLSVTNRGSIATSTLTLYGGATGTAFTATSTGVAFDGRNGTAIFGNVSATRDVTVTGKLAIGQATTTSPLTINGADATNIPAITINNAGQGTGGILINNAAGGSVDLGFTSGSNFTQTYTNRSVHFQVANQAFDPTSDFDFKFTASANPAKHLLWIGGSEGQTADLIRAFTENASSSPVFRVTAGGNVYASGTAYIATDVIVNGQSVCLANGVNCPASSGSSPFSYDATYDTIVPATSTSDVLIGGTTSTFAPFRFLTQSTTSRLLIGANGSSTDVLIGGATSTIANPGFQLDGNDLFVAGNIGSASSVYTNAAFVAGNGTTMFGDGFITKSNTGDFTISTLDSDSFIRFSTNGLERLTVASSGNIGIGVTNPSESLDIAGNIKNTIRNTDDVQFRSFLSFGTSTVSSLDIQGKYAYVGTYYTNPDTSENTAELRVVDISNPDEPRQVGMLAGLACGPDYMKISGNYLYGSADFGCTQESQIIIDIANPNTPILVASSTIPFARADISVDVSGNYMYAVDVDSYLRIYDVSSPVRAVLVSSSTVSVPEVQNSFIAVRGRYAYITYQTDRTVYIVDVLDPANPVVVGSVAIEPDPFPQDVAVEGNRLYIASNDYGLSQGVLQIVDISDPVNPLYIASSTSPGYILQSLDVSGGNVYGSGSDFASTGAGIHIFDVADTAAPTYVGSAAGGFTNQPLTRLTVEGKYAYGIAFGDEIFETSGVAIYEIPGLETSVVQAGNGDFGNLSVQSDAAVSGQLTVGGSLSLGSGGINSAGGITSGGSIKNPLRDVSGFREVGSLNVGSAVSFLPDVVGNYMYYPDYASDSFGVIDVSDVSAPQLVGSVNVNTGADPFEVESVGTYVFMTAATALYTIDVSDPTDPTVVATTSFNGVRPYGLVANGRYLYMEGDTGSDSDFYVVDISNPLAPTTTGSIVGSGVGGTYTQYKDGFVYVGNSPSEELRVIDVRDPANPAVVATLPLSAGFEILAALHDHYLYLHHGGSDFSVIDIANPFNPVQVATTTGEFSLSTIFIEGRYMYAPDGGSSIVVFDLSDPTNPVHVGDIPTTECGFVPEGKYLYILCSGDLSQDMTIFEIPGIDTTAVLASSAEVDSLSVMMDGSVANQLRVGGSLLIGTGGLVSQGSLVISSTATSTIAGPLLVQGQRVCLADGTNCPASGGTDTLLSVTNRGSIATSTLTLYGGATGTAFTATSTSGGGFRFATNGNIDIGTPTLSARNLYASSTVFTQAVQSTGTLFVMSGSGVINFQTPGGGGLFTINGGSAQVYGNVLPALAGVDIGSSANAWQNGYFTGTVSSSALTFTSATGSRLSLNSFTNVRAIATTTIAITGSVEDVTVAGKYAYLKSSASAGTLIYDISNPAAPSSVGVIAVTSQDIAVAGKYVYDAIGTTGLAIYDVSNPSSPTAVATEDTAGVAFAVAVSGKYAYVADGSGGLVVMDVSDPTNPRTVGIADGFGNADGIYVQGRYAFVIDSTSNTFKIVDVASSTEPVITASLGLNDPLDIFVSGRYAYVADGAAAGLVIIDIGDPSAPEVVGTADTAGAAIGVVVAGNYAYVADGAPAASKVAIIDITNVNAPSVVTTLRQGNSCSKVAISGPYLYAACTESTDLMVYDLGGINSPTGKIGSLETDAFAVNDNATFGNQVDIGGGLTVGYGGIQSMGALAAQGISSIIDNNASGTAGLFYRSFNGGTEVDAAIGISSFVTGTDGSIDDLPTLVELNNTLNFSGGNVLSAAGYFVNGVDDASGQSPALLAIDMTSSTTGGAIYGSRNCGGSTLSNVMRLATDSNTSIFRVNCNGTIFADDGVVSSPGDYAEFFPTADVSIMPGEVVALEAGTTSTVKRAASADRSATLGVVSTNPLILGNAGEDGERMDDPNYKIIGLLGQIPTKASTIGGEIRAGDKLMAGDDGFAVKASGVGMVIGRALEALSSATGTIMVYVDPQWSADGIFEAAPEATIVKSFGTATASSTVYDSYGLTFQGSAWSTSTNSATASSFTIMNDVINASSSLFRVKNMAGTALLTISDLGDVSVNGDLTVGGRLFLGSKATGEGSTSTYIYVDDTQAPSSTYVATNADGWSTSSTYDYAERFPSNDALNPGDLVTTAATGTNYIKRSTAPTDIILGIISTKPGFVTGGYASGTYPVALAGRVPTRVSTANGAILPGDQLAPSDVPGVAVKAVGSGPVVGVALQSYDAPTEGLVSVFVQPGWKGGEIVSEGNGPSTIVYQIPTYDPGLSPRAGLAKIAAGSTSVNVAFQSLNAYPLVSLTPYGLPTSEWGIIDVTDHGFTITLSQPETFDLVFSWKAEPSPLDSTMSFSDGTSGPYDPLTGQPVTGISASSTPPELPTSTPPVPPDASPPTSTTSGTESGT